MCLKADTSLQPFSQFFGKSDYKRRYFVWMTSIAFCMVLSEELITG